MTHAILIAVGSDRPGLVDEVSQFIFDHGGNIEDSRMVNLRGQFAMMLLVAGEESTFQRLRDDLSDFSARTDLHAELRPAGKTAPAGTAGAAPASEKPAEAGHALPYHLTVTALDQPGLVHRIAHALRALQANIESLETHLAPAPITGAPLFEMELTLALPAPIPLSKLRQTLASVCDELNVDWVLERA
jgi:glycine cleavage system transcriptional repressor